MPIFRLNKDGIREVPTTKFADLGIGERSDIQRVLQDNVDVIEPGILVIAEEFGEWEDSRRRIDLLGIDRDANVVVIELKRTEDGGHMDLQAIRYAAMVSALTFERACDIFEDYLSKRKQEGDARELLLKHLGSESSEETELSGEVRIMLVAADFSKEITTSALWLYDNGIDIRCVRMTPYEYQGDCLLDVQQLIPLKEAAEYQVGLRDKRQRQRTKSKLTRDLKRFTVLVGGETFSNLAKRRAALKYVTALVGSGTAPEAINDTISWRTVFYQVPNDEAGQPSLTLLAQQYKVTKPDKIWFLGEDESVMFNGHTYLVGKQWGRRTEEALRLLADTFRPTTVRYEVEE